MRIQESPVHAVKEIPAYTGMTVFRTTLNITRIKNIYKVLSSSFEKEITQPVKTISDGIEINCSWP